MRVGIDTGGTFTDFVLVDDRGTILRTHKRLSTPDDPARAVIEGLAVLLGASAECAAVVHGTTVATNALLEGKGAAVAFVTTAGFEDTLHLGRQNRPDLYALHPRRPDPPVARDRCVGVPERMRHDGTAIAPLSDAAVAATARRVAALGVESVAVSLLHGYANPEHERRIARALRQAMPDVPVTVSHELLPELREYERAATCVANAAVAPTIVRYLSKLEAALAPAGRGGGLRIMASDGGALPVEAICRSPVQTMLSGPAGGVLGAMAMAQAAGVERVVGLDMGGTSTDVSLCHAATGRVSYTTESVIGSLPVRLPIIDIHTVGAGGGSIAWLDGGGALRVGPQSAGADPGPACYGRQGAQLTATVTDAHVVLGHLPADRPLGGDLRLDEAAARRAVAAVAQRLGSSVERAAEGILRVADATMARAIQRISVQRGHDARDCTLVPFGGAGGLHACRLAAMLGMRRVLVPVHPGLLSALGMLTAPPRYAFSHAVMTRVEPGRPVASPRLSQVMEELRRLGEAALDADGVPTSHRRFEPGVDLRYAGQSFELTVPLDDRTLDAFAAEHGRLYGYVAPDRAIEVVAARLVAVGPAPSLQWPSPPRRDAAVSHRVISRDDLGPGDMLAGPRIVTELSATTLVPAGWRLTVHDTGQLLIEPGALP